MPPRRTSTRRAKLATMSYRFLADVVVGVHALYVAFVVFGLAAILIGYARGWRWVRNRHFRILHLAAILLVCAESIIGIDCPLTRLENALRFQAGENGYGRDFFGYWIDKLIFYDFPGWVFATIYLAFGAVVVSTLWLVPLRPAKPENASPTDR